MLNKKFETEENGGRKNWQSGTPSTVSGFGSCCESANSKSLWLKCYLSLIQEKQWKKASRTGQW